MNNWELLWWLVSDEAEIENNFAVESLTQRSDANIRFFQSGL